MPSALRPALIAAFVVAVAVPATQANQRLPRSIDVFTTSDRPVRAGEQFQARMYLLDGLKALERSLSQGLPSTPEKAKAVALRRLNDLGDALQEKVDNAVEGLSLATSYQLRKLPAIVFDDGQSVVYGVDRLDRAIAIYRDGIKP